MEEPFIPLGDVTLLALIFLYAYLRDRKEKMRTQLTRKFKRGEK